jgi:membrane protein
LILPALEGIKEFTFRRDLPGYPMLDFLRGALFYVLSVGVVAAVFYALYRFVPSDKIDNQRAIISALWATALWEIAKQAFGLYVTNFATLHRIYGAYLLIVISALWIYYSSLVFIVAAEIGQLYSERATTRWARLSAYFAKRRFGKISKI